jgi:xylose isomerase
MARWKTSVGIWAFGPAATRFVPGGYHPEQMAVPTAERVKRAVEGLGPLIDGYEFHYESEIDESNLAAIQDALGRQHDIYCICYGLVPNAAYKLGSLINPDPSRRRAAVDHMKRGIDLAASVGAHWIYWPGNEGYNYPFQRDYARIWKWFLDGTAEAVDYANARRVTFLLEHKNSEPAMNILMRNIGMKLHVIHKLREMGVDTSRVKVNMDWQHLIMNGENLGEYAGHLLAEGLLGHQHANSGWGSFDDDNLVGAQFIEQQVDLAYELIHGGYGTGGERIGFDLYPYTEDAVAAVRRSVIQWEFLSDIARHIDREEMSAAKTAADAVGAYRAFYRALGLTSEYEREVIKRYEQR